MGSKLSCCKCKATPKDGSASHRRIRKSKIGSKKIRDVNTPSDLDQIIIRTDVPHLTNHHEINSSVNHNQQPNSKQSCYSLQHISEREPLEDVDIDPSTNPTTGPLFMKKSSSKNLQKNRRSQVLLDHRNHQKYSSTSTIYLDDSTVTNPNLKTTIKCVSLAIYFHIKNREEDNITSDVSKTFDIFDERLHPMTVKTTSDAVMETSHPVVISEPDHRMIYRFMRTLFNAAQLPPECAIITLVYVERLLTYAETGICPETWKRIVLGAILLASKVWDDQAVWNVDYCQILRDITVEDMNDLEKQFLELLQFNINVPSSVYAKYYFDLRTLADQNDMTFPIEPISRDRAIRLEAMSHPLGNQSMNPKKWCSCEALSPIRKSRAVIS